MRTLIIDDCIITIRKFDMLWCVISFVALFVRVDSQAPSPSPPPTLYFDGITPSYRCRKSTVELTYPQSWYYDAAEGTSDIPGGLAMSSTSFNVGQDGFVHGCFPAHVVQPASTFHVTIDNKHSANNNIKLYAVATTSLNITSGRNQSIVVSYGPSTGTSINSISPDRSRKVTYYCLVEQSTQPTIAATPRHINIESVCNPPAWILQGKYTDFEPSTIDKESDKSNIIAFTIIFAVILAGSTISAITQPRFRAMVADSISTSSMSL